MKSIDVLKGCKDLYCILQILEKQWGEDVNMKIIRQGGGSEVSSWSYGSCSGRKFSQCPELHGACLNPRGSAVYATATQH